MEIARIGGPLARAARRRFRAVPVEFRFRTARANRIDTCGCAMGARFLAAALLLSTLWYVWRCHASMLSAKAALLRIALISFLGAGLGKAIGIALARMRAPHLSRK